MSRYKEDLEGLARFESEEERLEAAARLDSIWDEEADHAAALDEARKENAEIVAERDALKVERDEYRDKYVSMYFTNPARAAAKMPGFGQMPVTFHEDPLRSQQPQQPEAQPQQPAEQPPEPQQPQQSQPQPQTQTVGLDDTKNDPFDDKSLAELIRMLNNR